MNNIIISIITPCYNHGAFLDETIQSVTSHNWSVPVEHIIINDGSTDSKTIEKLNSLKNRGIVIIDQANGGPANARNTAINLSKGKYILPLDADNILVSGIFEKALQIMERDTTIDVVYTNALCFGDENYTWEPGEIEPVKLLAGNYLDTCSLLRKSTLTSLGNYDDKIPVHGNEDWELWLKYFFNHKKFYWLKETGFHYRVKNNSLSKTESAPKQAIINEYLVKKYAANYAAYYQYLFKEKGKFENLKTYLKDSKMKSIAKIILNKPVIDY